MFNVYVMGKGYDCHSRRPLIQLIYKESTDKLHLSYKLNPLKWPIDLLLSSTFQ